MTKNSPIGVSTKKNLSIPTIVRCKACQIRIVSRYCLIINVLRDQDMSHNVNLAIQILPLRMDKTDAYAAIDKAIECVKASGLKYIVCPFETVIEGPYDKVMQLMNDMQEACYSNGVQELLVNMKLHRSVENDMAIDDKIGKYR